MKKSYKSNYLISEVLEDIMLFGLNAICYKYISKSDGFIKDYLLEEAGDEEPLYIDEEREKVTLYELLVSLVEQNSIIEITELSCKLIGARYIADLTQQELADKLSIHRQTVGKYENGERKPKLERLQEIAKECNMPLKLFIEELD